MQADRKRPESKDEARKQRVDLIINCFLFIVLILVVIVVVVALLGQSLGNLILEAIGK